MKKARSVINPCCSGAACSWSDSRGAAAEESSADRISRCSFSVSSDSTRREAFLQGLRDLGYVDGKNIAIEYRYTEGELDLSTSRPS